MRQGKESKEKSYLEPKSLGRFLRERLDPDIGKEVRISVIGGKYFKVDYCSETYKLIVEHDGPDHYKADAKVILDRERQRLLTEAGYRVIRVPYFVQMVEPVIGILFGGRIENRNPFKEWPQGFNVTKNLPAYYSEMGVELFLEDLKRFAPIRDEIISSLQTRAEKAGDWRLVYPKSLGYLYKPS
jgi:very-short-patch-repair endonuclease